ncbi:MAG: hypothetical protein VZS44_06885 [Bacilli bacterium]|nr:hypothetical protein [Bacilli bacterium]
MEELTIKNIEETPLSQGKTLTELKEEMENDKESLEAARKKEIIGYGVAGLTFLAGTVAAFLTQNVDVGLWSFYSGAGVGILSSFYGKYDVGLKAWKSNKSYDKYYEALKEEMVNGEEEVKGRNR